MVAGEGDLCEEPTGVRSPVRTDEGALVGASPRQAHDVDATAHRPRARAIAADVEDAIGFAGGFLTGPGGPQVDSDAREGFLLVNVLGCHVGEARARANGCGSDGVDGLGQALVAWCREHEGGSDARVTQASPSGVPVKVEQGSVGEDAHNQVGVRRLGEFVDNGGVGVGDVQRRKARTGHEARVGDSDGGSHEVVVAVVIVIDESPAECVVSCARVVVGAVGAFRGEAAFEGFAHRFGQERPGDGVGRCDRVRVKCGDAWRRPVVGGEDAELFVGEASRRVVSALVGSGCAVRSRRLARVRASGLVASLRDEAVAGVVIVCPSTQQPCGCSTSVKRYGGATRRRWRRFPG